MRSEALVSSAMAFANVGEMNLREIAEVLVEREEVGEGLAGMFELAESVDHRNAGVGCHLFDDHMAEGAEHDDVDPAFEVVGDVVERLAGIQAAGRLVDEEGAAAQA